MLQGTLLYYYPYLSGSNLDGQVVQGYLLEKLMADSQGRSEGHSMIIIFSSCDSNNVVVTCVLECLNL